MLPALGRKTTADYGMGLVPIFFSVIFRGRRGDFEAGQSAMLLKSAARMAALIFAIMEDRISKQVK